MDYRTQKDAIIIDDISQFNAQHILECGQIFRYQKQGDIYTVFSKDKLAQIVPQIDTNSHVVGYKIITHDVEYFVKFFDLDNDYNKVKQNIILKYNNYLTKNESQLANSSINDTQSQQNFIQRALSFGSGIRLLCQDHLEAIICFVISQNNNIKKIQKIIEQICEKCGLDMGNFYAFPTLKQLSKLSVQDFKDCGAGYRAEYLVNTVQFLQTFDDQNFMKLSLDDQISTLLSVKGIGAKVADCVLLFGYHNMSVFPVDTWIEKVYNTYFNKKNSTLTRQQIRQQLTSIFGDLSGYIQQYLFYFERSK